MVLWRFRRIRIVLSDPNLFSSEPNPNPNFSGGVCSTLISYVVLAKKGVRGKFKRLFVCLGGPKNCHQNIKSGIRIRIKTYRIGPPERIAFCRCKQNQIYTQFRIRIQNLLYVRVPYKSYTCSVFDYTYL